jgi:hypothetical protein
MARSPQNGSRSEAETPQDLPPQTAEALFLTVGKGISIWQSVEMALSAVFLQLITPRTDEIGRAIFYSANDFETKLRLVHNVARLALTRPLIEEWQDLRKRLTDAQQQRNTFAHFAVTQRLTLNPEPRNPGDRIPLYGGAVDFLIVPNHEDPLERFRDRGKRSLKPMNKRDAENAISEFTALRAALLQLAAKTRRS